MDSAIVSQAYVSEDGSVSKDSIWVSRSVKHCIATSMDFRNPLPMSPLTCGGGGGFFLARAPPTSFSTPAPPPLLAGDNFVGLRVFVSAPPSLSLILQKK